MNRQESFEALWAARHNLPVETLAQYRFDTKDGYRLPSMAAHYRTHCEALDSVMVRLPGYQIPREGGPSEDFQAGWNKCLDWSRESNEGFTVEVHKS